MERTLELVAFLLVGPLVGIELGVAAVTNPLVARLADGPYRQVRSEGSRLLGFVMPFWYIAALLALIATAFVSGERTIVGAVVVMALVMLLSVAVLVPINNRIGRWSTDADVNRELARRWDRLHWLRVVLLIAMFVLLVLGLAP